MMREEIRLVVCDLDDTLLNDQQRITAYSEAVLKALRAKGIKLCFASGRDEQMMAAYVQQVGGCDYLITNNGAVVRDARRKVLHSSYLPREDAEAILDYLQRKEIPCMLQGNDSFYASDNGQPLLRRVKTSQLRSEENGFPIEMRIRNLRDAQPEGALEVGEKIVAYETQEEQRREYRAFLQGRPGVRCEATGYGLVGVFSKDVSKQDALERVKSHLGITARQVCVFGDYDNDLSMFACADHRICVANAVPALKAAATAITDSNNEDGVAKYLQKMLDIRLQDRKIPL